MNMPELDDNRPEAFGAGAQRLLATATKVSVDTNV